MCGTIDLNEDVARIKRKTKNDSIVFFTTEGGVPKHLWESHGGFGYEHAPSMQIERDGIVYGSTKNGLLFALDAMTGNVIWKHKVGNSLINTITVLSHKRVLFTTTGGIIGLLKTE